MNYTHCEYMHCCGSYLWSDKCVLRWVVDFFGNTAWRWTNYLSPGHGITARHPLGASMRIGLILFRFAVSVSFADENTRSQGTDVAWIGR
jgi:hypothetical protein